MGILFVEALYRVTISQHAYHPAPTQAQSGIMVGVRGAGLANTVQLAVVLMVEGASSGFWKGLYKGAFRVLVPASKRLFSGMEGLPRDAKSL